MSETDASKKTSIKNPLFHNSNFFVDDITHNALILTPAPPFKKEEEQTSAYFSIDNQKSLPTNIDNFSEINLHSPKKFLEISTTSFDQNENSDPQSFTSGLSASFAQIPNVASNVFSSFSRVIRGNSTLATQTCEDLKLEKSSETQHICNLDSDSNQHDITIPTLYSPDELNILKYPNQQNKAKEKSKKKCYAKYPGLSSNLPLVPIIPNNEQSSKELKSIDNPFVSSHDYLDNSEDSSKSALRTFQFNGEEENATNKGYDVNQILNIGGSKSLSKNSVPEHSSNKNATIDISSGILNSDLWKTHSVSTVSSNIEHYSKGIDNLHGQGSLINKVPLEKEFSNINRGDCIKELFNATHKIVNNNNCIETNQQHDQNEISNEQKNITDFDYSGFEEMDEINNDNGLTTDVKYRPVYYHWFYEIVEDLAKTQWTPFSMKDSMALEEAMAKSRASNFLVPTDGGRYDVSLSERKRIPIYWNGLPNAVRRCSWFYKALDSHFVPYEESTAEKLEEQYCEAFRTGKWQKKILLENGETIVFHGPSVIVHFLHSQTADSWTGTQATNRPRVVKRGIDHFNIEDGESDQIDHLVFMIHGIGKACDLKFRTIEEAVNEFRNISNQLVQAHYRNSCDLGIVNRVEVLPVSWHVELHSEEFGIDEKLKLITLQSIPKLRGFANETLLDILFYSSPKFCQTIISIVGNQLNNLIHVFKERNPNFKGGISLGGHSLGSLILFDLLSHQTDDCNGTEPQSLEQQNSVNTIGGGTGQPFINYPQLAFKIKNFFALGSPISMFVTVRGISELGQNYRLPTCEGFFNIFHPYDPVAYRFEPLIYPEMSKVNPVLIPHHKGRKRMHLELKETMHRVGTDLKQRIVCTFQNTMQAVYSLTTNKQIIDQAAIEDEVNKALENQLNQSIIDRSECVSETSETDQRETELQLGQMNKSRRIDYMLQESVLEYCNEYLFALTSHVCYWESEDTILFMMKEIYSSMGVSTDSQIPQHTLKIERLTGDQNSSIK